MNDPYISVIVTAFNRRRYLREALHSLEQQLLDRSKFEVIVVKNFDDCKADKIIKRNGWKWVYSNEARQGSFIAAGLDEAKGDVVTFLEDDDLYAPERLAYVYAAFKKIKGLIWFHNLQHYIDDTGKPVPNYSGWPMDSQPPFDVLLSPRDKSWLRVFIKYGDFHHNLSSIAVVRHIAKELRMFSSTPDLTLTVLAGFNEGLMFHTKRRLTLYRITTASMTKTSKWKALLMLSHGELLARFRKGCLKRRLPMCYVLINHAWNFIKENEGLTSLENLYLLLTYVVPVHLLKLFLGVQSMGNLSVSEVSSLISYIRYWHHS